MTIGFTFNASAQGALRKNDNCEIYLEQAAKLYDVPLPILLAVGLTESGRNGALHPYALNVEGESKFPATVETALSIFLLEAAKGKKLIDIGCMQINHFYHHEKFSSLASMFDPKQNIFYAAKFLKTLKTRYKTWEMAIARYHAGPDNNAAQAQYVCKVISSMVKVGMGEWTAKARNFCAK